MTCPDSATIWAMDAGELSGDALLAARSHARMCLVCEGARRELVKTRELLTLAATSTPAVSWRSVDTAVDDAIMKAAARSFSGWSWRAWMAPMALATALLLFVAARPPQKPQSAANVMTVAVAPVVVVKREDPPAVVAAPTPTPRVKKRPSFFTGPKTMTLPNGARVQLGANAVASTRGDRVELRQGELLSRGKSVIDINGSLLRPSADAVVLASLHDVAVMEGSVLVERSDGSSLTVHAGESVRFERGARASSGLDVARFASFGITVRRPVEVSADLLFIQRAQKSLKQGRCGDFLLGLETLAFDAEAPSVRANARIVKARCHDERLEPTKAAADYSRYLRDFPDGDAAAEARAALRAQ